MADNRIHFKPFNDNRNVRCLNGSAHAKASTDFNSVTCEACRDLNNAKRYWHEYEEKNGNVNKNRIPFGFVPRLKNSVLYFIYK